MTLESYHQPSKLRAIEALHEAQKIAFAPIVFQASRCLLDLGVLRQIEAAGDDGISFESICENCGLPEYGISVLLDFALSIGLVWLSPSTKTYRLNKVSHYLLNDAMTAVNFNFVRDVNYLGMDELLRSILESRPCGLKYLAEGQETIYPVISNLPPAAKKSWFDFDHFYSDNSFAQVLDILSLSDCRQLLEIGANTGKWTSQVLLRMPNIFIHLCDLPSQIELCRAKFVAAPNVSFTALDVLSCELPEVADVDLVFMSQFLDCFSSQEIIAILRKVKKAYPQAKIAILEIFWDKQPHPTASFVINAASLYFTTMANGNSRFYSYDVFGTLIEAAGLALKEQHHHIGIGGHSLVILQ